MAVALVALGLAAYRSFGGAAAKRCLPAGGPYPMNWAHPLRRRRPRAEAARAIHFTYSVRWFLEAKARGGPIPRERLANICGRCRRPATTAPRRDAHAAIRADLHGNAMPTPRLRRIHREPEDDGMSGSLTRGDRKLLLAAGAASLLLVALTVTLSPAGGNTTENPTTYSAGSGGAKAVYLLLGAAGYSVIRWEQSPRDLPVDANVTLILAEP